MPFSSDIQGALTTRLNQAKTFIVNDAGMPINNYQDALTAVVNEEFRQEISALDVIIISDAPDAFLLFDEQCKKRALQNQDTCLSLLNQPLSKTNQLYIDFIAIIYPLATMADYCRLLLPATVTHSVVPHFTMIAKQIDFTLVTKPLIEMTEPFNQDELPNFLVANDILFNVKDICFYDLKWHQLFFQAMYQQYPELSKAIYEHNVDLKTLSAHLRMLSDNGPTLLEVLTQLIKELRLGGQAITGEVLASPSAAIAVTHFSEYVDALPKEVKSKVLALHSANNAYSLSGVLEHFRNLDCVETAANQIEEIVKNQKILNAPILYQVPSMSEEVYLNIQQRYKQGSLLSSVSDNKAMALPSCYIDTILPRLLIRKMSDIIISLVSFPTEMYAYLLGEILHNPSYNKVFKLVTLLNSGILSSQQITAIYDLILLNMESFSLDNALDVAIATSSTDLISNLLCEKSSAEVLSLLRNNTDKNDRLSRIKLAASCPEVLSVLLNYLEPNDKLILMQKTPLLSEATTHDGSLRLLYDVYSKNVCIDAIKNKKNEYFFDTLLKNAHSLAFFLEQYGKEEIINLLGNDESLAYWLYKSTKYPQSLALILPFYDTTRLKALLLNIYGDNDKTMRHHLNQRDNKYHGALDALINVLPLEHRIPFILHKEPNGDTLLHECVTSNKKLMALIGYFDSRERLFEVLQIANNRGITIMHGILNNPLLLKMLFLLMPDMPWLSVFQKRNSEGKTLAQIVTGHYFYYNAILSIFNDVPLELRFVFLSNENIIYNPEIELLLKNSLSGVSQETQGNLFIKYLTCSDSTQALRLLLKYMLPHVSADQIVAWVPVDNGLRQKLLFDTIYYPQLFQACFRSLTESERLEALLTPITPYKTWLQLIIAHYPNLLKEMLSVLTSQSIICLINQKDCVGFTPLFEAISNKDAVKAFLLPLSAEMRWAVINNPNLYTVTFGEKALSYPETWAVILELLSDEQRSELLSKKTWFGTSFGDKAVSLDEARQSGHKRGRFFTSLEASTSSDEAPEPDAKQRKL